MRTIRNEPSVLVLLLVLVLVLVLVPVLALFRVQVLVSDDNWKKTFLKSMSYNHVTLIRTLKTNLNNI